MSKRSQRVWVTHGESACPVGELRFETDGRRQSSVFRYASRWLESPNRFAIAPTMPLTATAFYNASRQDDQRAALPAPLSDGSPDSWGRGLIRHAHPGPLSEIDYLLLADDATRQGALRYRDEGSVALAPTEAPVPGLGELAQVASLAQRAGDPALSAEQRLRLFGSAGSLGGARPKANVRDANGLLCIAKFTAREDTMPVEQLEVGTLALARLAGVQAASARVVLAGTGRPAALIVRFDRTADGGRVGYLSAQSFLGVGFGATAYYTDIADALRAHGHDPKTQLGELYRRMLFTILVSNNDDHLKNHGFLHAGDGRWVLAPAFDINPQPLRHRRLATGVTEQAGNAASIEAALEAAPFFDLDADAAGLMLAHITRVVAADWRRCLERAGLATKQVAQYAPAFAHEEHERARRLTRFVRDR